MATRLAKAQSPNGQRWVRNITLKFKWGEANSSRDFRKIAPQLEDCHKNSALLTNAEASSPLFLTKYWQHARLSRAHSESSNMRILHTVWSPCLAFSLFACSGGVEFDPATSGGQGSGGQGSGDSGGSNSSGGSRSGGAANAGGAGPFSGGAASGGAASGGNASGGGQNGGGQSGGAQSGGSQGDGGGQSGGATASGGGGGKPPAEASGGCGKANPMLGSSGSPLTVSGHQYYVKLPTNYDPDTPYPTVIMFNPTGNPITWAEQNAGYEKNGAKDAAIRVYPHPANSSNGWGAGDVSFFEPLYDKITADYCIDKARVFAAGESSGGDFSSILGCEHADKLRAIAPCATKNVGQYPLNADTRQCTGQVAAIIIHGKNDNVVGPENGPKTRDFYTALNHCGTMSDPVEGYTTEQSNCVLFQGCDDNYPVYWCQHTDPEYSNTNHGWPKFAGNMTWETFSKY